MIKKFHEIRLSDIINLDATKSARCLMKYPLPVWLFRNQLEVLAKQIFDAIGNKSIDNIEEEFDKLYYFNRIQIYESLYKAVTIELSMKPKILAWKMILQRDFKESKQLEEVIEAVKKHTGIELNQPEDLQTLIDFIEHKVAKYKEMFPDEEQGEPVKLGRVIYSVFNFMGEDFNENIRLINFLDMKEAAEERVKTNSKQDGIN